MLEWVYRGADRVDALAKRDSAGLALRQDTFVRKTAQIHTAWAVWICFLLSKPGIP